MARISADNEGLYQQDITGGEALVITIEPRTTITPEGIQVIVHDGDEPVYVKRGSTVVPRDPGAQMVTPGAFLQVDGTPIGHEYQIAVVSHADATISVARS